MLQHTIACSIQYSNMRCRFVAYYTPRLYHIAQVCSRLYYLGLCQYTFTQRRNRLTTHFSECIPVVERRISVFPSKREEVKRNTEKCPLRNEIILPLHKESVMKTKNLCWYRYKIQRKYQQESLKLKLKVEDRCCCL